MRILGFLKIFRLERIWFFNTNRARKSLRVPIPPDIIINVLESKSLNAFDFHKFNKNLHVEINSTHLFYIDVYSRASREQKNLLDFMIVSMCQMIFETSNERVQRLDRKFLERWSEHIEGKLSGVSFE